MSDNDSNNNDKITIVLSASRLDKLACMREYQYIYMLNKKPMLESEALEKGSLIHELAKHFYKNLNDLGKEQSVQLAIEAGRQYAIGLDLPIDECEEQISNFQDYCNFYANDGWLPVKIEEPFAKLFHEDENIRIILEGRVDLIIVRSQDTSKKIVVDHKGTSRSEKRPNKLTNQFQLLSWAFDTDMVVRNEIGFQKSYKPADRFKRNILNYDKSSIEDWKKWTLFYILDRYEKLKHNIFPPDYTKCKYCQFNEVCSSTPDNREWVLQTRFANKLEYNLFESVDK
jgi:CRISPR/Cas system-associated exonuclease Cas4 (RecB family)